MAKVLTFSKFQAPRCDACETPISEPHSVLHIKQEGGRKAFMDSHLCYTCSNLIWQAIKDGKAEKRLIHPVTWGNFHE
jgi:hypothetical protein